MILLIADDEDNIREGLRDTIDWNELGFEKVITAENGVDALEKYNNFNPDLIITDIKMPGLSGLELSKKIKQNKGEPEIIILSGYSEFEYAREAIDLEVLHYHIKPVNLGELRETVSRATEKIIARKKIADDLLEQEHLMIKNDLADFLAGKTPDAESVEKIFRVFNHFGSSTQLSLLTIAVERANPAADKTTENFSRQLLETILSSWLSGKQHLTQIQDPFYTVIYENKFVFSNRQSRKSIHALKQELDRHFADTVWGFSISYAGSTDYTGLPEYYRTSLSLFDCRLYLGAGSVILASEQRGLSGTDHNAGKEKMDEQELIGSIQCFDIESCTTILTDAMDGLKQQRCTSSDTVTNNCIRFRNILVHTLNLSPESHGHFLAGNLSFFTEIPQLISIDQYKNWIVCIYEKVLDSMRKLNGVRHFPAMNQAVKYINEHYTEHIPIETIARQVQLHPDHFSRLFKKEIGLAFSRYVNKVRIEHAKKLLKETNLLAYEVASQTGFKNYKYFVQVFKDLEGYSPSRLRK